MLTQSLLLVIKPFPPVFKFIAIGTGFALFKNNQKGLEGPIMRQKPYKASLNGQMF